jgi:prolyl-tRNA synthetase
MAVASSPVHADSGQLGSKTSQSNAVMMKGKSRTAVVRLEV